jgi:hypothetical protein
VTTTTSSRTSSRTSNNGKATSIHKETVKIEEVTPAKAQQWLEGNVDNRKLREDRVLAHARVLQAGEWELGESAIVFDDQGVLINGQHRLSAVIVSGIPARFIILRGVPSQTQEIMDTGLGRNLADQLTRRGLVVSHANILSGALYWTHQLAYNEETGNVHYSEPSERPTLRQLLQIWEKHEDMADHVRPVSRLRSATKVRPGPACALRYRLFAVDPEEAEMFFDIWTTGENLKRDDPILRLREWTLEDARLRGVRGRAPTYRFMAMSLKAWNLWRDQMPCQKLIWVFSPSKKEVWPIPH